MTRNMSMRPGPKHRRARAALLLVAATATACASTPAAPASEPSSPAHAPKDWRALLRDDYPPPDKPWQTMSHDERKAYMRDVVAPTMQELFIAFNPDTHASFGCRTCHGPNARERDYAMPSSNLFTLYPSGSPEQKRTVAEKEEAARFMFNAVTPTVRQLLGLPRFDKDTGEGFSCFRCHPQGQSGMGGGALPGEPL